MKAAIWATTVQEMHSEERPGGLGHHATYIQAGHIYAVAHNHVNELVWRAVFSEEDFSIEDL